MGRHAVKLNRHAERLIEDIAVLGPRPAQHARLPDRLRQAMRALDVAQVPVTGDRNQLQNCG